MSYELIARPGAGHQGIAPTIPQLEGDACCSSCEEGGGCEGGLAGLIKSTPANWAMLGIGLLIAAYVIRSPRR